MNSEKLLTSLETASKQHEESVVIELGTDRLIRWIGVYTTLFLAVVTKIADFGTSSIACYPVGGSEPNRLITAFAATYCWASSGNNDPQILPLSNVSTCIAPDGNITLSRDPTELKRFVAYFPYFIIGQALIFALPLAYWHFRVGAPLLGHLRFMQLLLTEIFDTVSKVKNGRPRKAYDPKCETLDGNRKQPEENKETPSTEIDTDTDSPSKKDQTISSDPVEPEKKTTPEGEQPPDDKTLNGKNTQPSGKQDVSIAVEGSSPPEKDADSPSEKDKMIPKEATKLGKKATPKKQNESEESDAKGKDFFDFLAGETQDRHLFSIMCYENFANLHHLPYIMSVFIINEFHGKPKKVMPTKKALMEIWCHEDNLTNNFLVKRYVGKHFVTACAALCMTGALIAWLVVGGLYQEIMESNTFGCQIPHVDYCLLCSIKRLSDIIVLCVIDLLLTMVVFVMSLYKLCDVRSSRNLYKAHFFENLKKTSNVSFEMKQSEAKEKKK